MTIAEAREKCKSIIARVPRDILIFGVIILAASLSFGFGYLAGKDAGQGSSVTIETPLPTLPAGTPTADIGADNTSQATGQVVASKNGTKYYLPNCSGVSRISEANKVWFASAAAARAQGYTPAANCKGL